MSLVGTVLRYNNAFCSKVLLGLLSCVNALSTPFDLIGSNRFFFTFKSNERVSSLNVEILMLILD